MSFFNKLFQKSDLKVLGLDIGSSAVKAVQLQEKNGRVYLDTYGSFVLGLYSGNEPGQAVQLDPEKTTGVIKEMLSEAQVSTTRTVATIPLSSSIISVIEMPDVSEKQLDQMIPLEAKKYIPSSLDEVMLDWSLVGEKKVEVKDEGSNKKEQIKKKEVMLVAIHKDILERQQNIIEQVELEAAAYEIEVFTIYRSALSNAGSETVLVVDMGASLTKLQIISEGVVRASHSINRGSQDITQAFAKSLDISWAEAEMVKRDLGISGKHPQILEASLLTLDYIFDEIRRIVNAYQARYSKAVEKVVFSGGGGSLPGLNKKAQDSLQMTVETARPFDNMVVPEFLKSTLEEIGPEFTVAVGAAMRGLEEK